MAMRTDRPGERRLRDQIRFLLDTARALSREPDLDALFARVYALVEEQFPTGSFFIALDAKNRTQMIVPFYVEQRKRIVIPDPCPIEGTVTGDVFCGGQPLLVRDLDEFGRLQTVSLGDEENLPTSSAIYAPLRIGERTLGVMSVQNTEPNCYDEHDLELLVAVAEQTAIAVENARRLAEIEQQRRELEMLVEIGRGLASDEFALEHMCRRIHGQLASFMDARIFYVALLNDEGDMLHSEYCVEGEQELQIEDVPVHRTFAESVLATREAIVIGDISTDPRVLKYDFFGDKATPANSLIMLPLQIGDRPLGIVSVQSRKTNAFNESALRLLRAIADQLSFAINNVQLYRQTERRADRDALTNLYNRRYAMGRLLDELQRAERRGTRVCVMMLDVDRFKEINDTYGHPIGDLALQSMADSLRRASRGSDVVCRYGGDEFLVIFPDLVEADTAPMVKRVRDELLNRTIPVPGGAIALEASMGVAVSLSATDAEALIADADRELYRDKARSRKRQRP
jgi:two-component system cell cycle response regulator